MTVYAVRNELRERGFFRPAALLLVAFTAVWSACFYGVFVGFVAGGYALILGPWVLVVMGLAAVFARAKLRVPLLACALWTLLVVVSVFGVLLAVIVPMAAIVPAALTLSAALAAWRPEVAVVLVFLLASAFGTLEALTPVPVGELVDLLLAGLWINTIWVYFVRGRDRPIWVWPGVLVVGAYLFVSFIEIFTAETFTLGLFGFRTIGWYVAAFILVAYAQWPAGTRERIGKGMLLVAAAVGAYATLRYIIGPSQKEAALAFRSTYTNTFEGKLGLFGSFASRHELAAWCTVIVPFCAVFALSSRGVWRLTATLATGFGIVALLGSEVRAAVFGVIAGLALAFVLFQVARGFGGTRVGTTVAGLMLVAVAATGIFTLTAGADEASLRRYQVLIEDPTRDPAFQGRLYKWGTAIDEIDERPAGHGLGSSGRVQQQYGRFVTIGSINIDNQYLALAFQQGLLLTGVFLLGVLMVLVELARRSVTVLDRQRATFGIAGAAALVAILVLAVSGEYLEGLTALASWFIVGLGVGQFTHPDMTDPT